MKIGVTLRNMGPQSAPEVMIAGARAAEAVGFESVWITDHIAIPPDDAEGSGGRYLDTLTTLAWLAGATETIQLGSGVLILPYRPALPTAKQVATVQEVSRGRLLLGVGIGWMDPEFNALGVDRHERGRISDETLDFLNTCFANDVVEANGQRFLFKPRPPKPPILIGGRAPHALERAVARGDGWLPMARHPGQIEADVRSYREMSRAAGRGDGQVVVMSGLPVGAGRDGAEARDILASYEAMGIDRLVCGLSYDTLDEYRTGLDAIAGVAL